MIAVPVAGVRPPAFSRPDIRAWGELGVGGRFGVNLFIYLPYYALALPLVVVAIVSLVPRPDRMFPLAGAMGLIGLFAFWILANDGLLVAQPELATYTVVGLGVAAAAIVPLLTAHHLRADRATT
ncbi:hypothetical protein E0H73_39590 [Kribbella pittospori]|uniref:Uncharacterized protein n=1 Tax=Kribbella pittospori TaxID=722689 RepID=A0A4R0KFF7_9ACTN|nr:hypothetical protein [Kribbella pittospori]TCC54255.1 hypothetical protein E0H73_39590 [Kribbella pittospori]